MRGWCVFHAPLKLRPLNFSIAIVCLHCAFCIPDSTTKKTLRPLDSFPSSMAPPLQLFPPSSHSFEREILIFGTLSPYLLSFSTWKKKECENFSCFWFKFFYVY
ncbi:hypothetical protein E2542_SST24906 [Spatholobus suberectus]|nr:hypothetical protein E2542_SST24906 [Spatholobus suberectus]